ncbi:hypothetical protein EKK97_22195 [Billgrantia tianxiuensis]|uniref:Uncharacterized protein n=1 Tax=Billgrantia tianxiuensis TaxID=2497861 RepID=A0A6I6SR14_9GAMM|nr:hypothetical protein EKK97_22195 [Halomonas tianxiuensis]
MQKILSRKCLEDDENLLLALYPPSYDSEKGIVTKSAFKNNGTSVSRKSILSVDDILQILDFQLSKPGRRIEGYGCIMVAAVKEAAKASEELYIEVTEDPVADNEAHAEIIAFDSKDKQGLKKKIPNPVAKEICRSLKITKR